MKTKLIICLCLISFITVGCGCNKETTKTQKEKLNFDVNFNVSKEQEIDGFKVSDISLIIEENNISKFSALVTNNNNKTYEVNSIIMKLVNLQKLAINLIDFDKKINAGNEYFYENISDYSVVTLKIRGLRKEIEKLNFDETMYSTKKQF